MQTYIGRDFSLTNPLTYFEAYMMATTGRFCKRHTSFAHFHIAVIANGQVREWKQAGEIKRRKEALAAFNRTLAEKDIRPQKQAWRVPAFILYLKPDKQESTQTLEKAWEELTNLSAAWSRREARPVCMAFHFSQLDTQMKQLQIPHIHFLYLKKARKADELPHYILANLLSGKEETV